MCNSEVQAPAAAAVQVGAFDAEAVFAEFVETITADDHPRAVRQLEQVDLCCFVYIGLFHTYIGLLCSHIGLFCGYSGLC